MSFISFDIVVIGAGHAGIEAATASARIGANTVLITNSEENFGELSCNPAIGGIGKGTVAREVDALDGIMARITDQSSIHRKNLNKSKGPAVYGPRHQVDRTLYKNSMKELIMNYDNLKIIISSVQEIIIKNNIACGIILEDNTKILAKSIICTTGTFLNGEIIIGNERYSAGRINERSSINLGRSIQNIGLKVNRLKTGTPCRIDINSIDLSKLQKQESELDTEPLSYMNHNTNFIFPKQIDCYITYTTTESHKIILENRNNIPGINGDIKFNGPRYCPSIESKVIRFSDKERHQIFLEKEGLDSISCYPNGISTSMSKELQEKFIKTIPGLENCNMLKYGYAIEYDFIDPKEILHTLETKKIKNLFLAGQIIGTTGYEEAAGLGIVAGINAALKILNKEFILDRMSYIGVMIDDLVTIGIDAEPYRLFTSRSEYRLSSRSDNADFRLTPSGIKIGLIKNKRKEIFERKINEYNKIKDILEKTFFTPHELSKFNINLNYDGIKRNAFEILQKNDNIIDKIFEICNIDCKSIDVEKALQIEAKYYPYLIRQQQEIEEIKKSNSIEIPKDFDFSNINSISKEIREKIEKFKPSTIGELSRIPGVTPAALNFIIIYLERKRNKF